MVDCEVFTVNAEIFWFGAAMICSVLDICLSVCLHVVQKENAELRARLDAIVEQQKKDKQQ